MRRHRYLRASTASGQVGHHQHEDEQRDEPGFGGELGQAKRAREMNRRTNRPAIQIATALRRRRRDGSRCYPAPGNCAPNPIATWLMVTRANAQNPQKTNACASPGRGRSRMTLACSITSPETCRSRGASGREREIREWDATCESRGASARSAIQNSPIDMQRSDDEHGDSERGRLRSSLRIYHGCRFRLRLRLQ